MNTAVTERPAEAQASTTATPVLAVKRRTIDSVLIGFGIVAVVVFAVGGGLLTRGHNFSAEQVSANVPDPKGSGILARLRSCPIERESVALALDIKAILLVPSVLAVADSAENWGRDCGLDPTHDPNC